jgi:ElaB/YqjD/DUF883 family membrane-anchored ribosome-binding protein
MNATSNGTPASFDSGPSKRVDGRDTTATRPASAEHDVHNLLADIQDLLGQLAHVADPDIKHLRVRLTETLNSAKRAVTEGSEQIRRQVRAGVRGGDAYVREQPWQAVGIAAAAGLLIGFLVAKR